MVGTWVDYNNKIYEVISETPTDYICKEVLYNEPTLKLKYGEIVAIGKKVLDGADI